jgi:hypothetical protein
MQMGKHVKKFSIEKSLDRHGFSLKDKIMFYRNIRRHSHFIMGLVILFLHFLNYTNITYINEHQCGLKIEDHLDEDSNFFPKPIEPGPDVQENEHLNKKKMANSSGEFISSQSRKSSNSTKYQFRIPDFFELQPHLKRNLEPLYLLSNNRSNVSIVMGVPTVKRKDASYLKPMLTSLFESMQLENKETRDGVLVVVMIAEV